MLSDVVVTFVIRSHDVVCGARSVRRVLTAGVRTGHRTRSAGGVVSVKEEKDGERLAAWRVRWPKNSRPEFGLHVRPNVWHDRGWKLILGSLRGVRTWRDGGESVESKEERSEDPKPKRPIFHDAKLSLGVCVCKGQGRDPAPRHMWPFSFRN